MPHHPVLFYYLDIGGTNERRFETTRSTENIHRKAIAEAGELGLNFKVTAKEFVKKSLDGTASLGRRTILRTDGASLTGQRNRTQKLAGTEVSAPSVLRRSALARTKQ